MKSTMTRKKADEDEGEQRKKQGGNLPRGNEIFRKRGKGARGIPWRRYIKPRRYIMRRRVRKEEGSDGCIASFKVRSSEKEKEYGTETGRKGDRNGGREGGKEREIEKGRIRATKGGKGKEGGIEREGERKNVVTGARGGTRRHRLDR